jgi:hypothetical protein
MNTKTIGNISEAKVLARLVELQYPVLLPFGDNERYDLVAELKSGVFSRIQVKTAYLTEDDVLHIPVCSSSNHCNQGKRDYHGQVDIILAYSPDTQKIYRLEITNVGISDVSLRLSKAKLKAAKIRYAIDYEF